MAPEAVICDVDISPWQSYLDGMGPKTRDYVRGKVVEALDAGSEFGRGVLGSSTNLQLIVRMSKEVGDNLGRSYVYTMLHAQSGHSDLIEKPNVIEAARKYPSKFRCLLRSIRRGEAENIKQYARVLGLTD